MSLFGRFLELSLPTDSVAESLDWYLQLGFTECQTGDIYDHQYAVVTDGRLYIGLHGSGIESVALTFVRPELSNHLAQLESLGVEVAETYQGDERFHQLALQEPSGLDIRLIEARTFSPAHTTTQPAVGQVRSLNITCRYPDDACEFWTAAGIDAHETDDGAYELLTPGMMLLLEAGGSAPVLQLHHPDTYSLIELLGTKNLSHRFEHGKVSLVSPEGLKMAVNS